MSVLQGPSVPCSLVISRPSEPRLAATDAAAESSPQHPILTPAYAELRPSRLLLPKPLVTELTDLYFQLIHNGPHTMFHVLSFVTDLEVGLIPEFIILAMMALSARYLSLFTLRHLV
jgi:hypothetical protein